MPNSKYLFDSDVLISAKNLHYNPVYCSQFWEWITNGHKAGVLFSIDKVKGELLNGDPKDPLYDWCQQQELENFFLDTKSAVSKWGQLSKWATDPNRRYLKAAVEKFLHVDSADAWLIAYAAAHAGDFVIITNESSAPDSTTTIKLPDAAAAMGVKTIMLHRVLAKHASGGAFTFTL